MPLRPPSPQSLHLLSRTACRRPLSTSIAPFSNTIKPKPTTAKEPPRLDPVSLHRLQATENAYYKRRSLVAGCGILFCAVGIYFTISAIDLNPPAKLDSRRPDNALLELGREGKVVVQKLGEEADVVDSGTTSVGPFPRVIQFEDRQGGEESSGGLVPGEAEYQLLGLGIRTVSFLRIQVYVVGMYIATDDIAAFQKALVNRIQPLASTLVAGEKDQLKALLFDPKDSEEVWSSVLQETGARTLIRIAPTRNTDFGHLRDAWVRQITQRSQAKLYKDECKDEAFGEAMRELKRLFGSGTVAKGKELLLNRDRKGKLIVWWDNGKAGPQRLGNIQDERISRMIWLNYLAGPAVASEPARKSIVEGVMEFVERPVGTVATQVHV